MTELQVYKYVSLARIYGEAKEGPKTILLKGRLQTCPYLFMFWCLFYQFMIRGIKNSECLGTSICDIQIHDQWTQLLNRVWTAWMSTCLHVNCTLLMS